jgi:hypothetical protein
VYDLPTPAEDAVLCEGWIEQLAQGSDRCPDSNHPPADRPGQVTKVCPLGFWALSRVIERQVVSPKDPNTGGSGFGIRAVPTAARSRLRAPEAALFAWSEKLNAAVPGQSDEVERVLNDVTGDHMTPVDTWESWATEIRDGHPSLLVLLSHTLDHQNVAALEIGKEEGGSRLKLVELVPEFVRAKDDDPPVVLLLGCDTAIERNEFRSFVAQFLDCQAALVVGTIAPVRGERVVPVAQAVIREMAAEMGAEEAAGSEPRTFGDLMLTVRRRLLQDGELTALCITSFGDADWRVGKPKE